jgi:hypothetical protein
VRRQGRAPSPWRSIVLAALEEVARLLGLLCGHAADELRVPGGAEAVGLRELRGRGRVALAPVGGTALGNAVIALDVNGRSGGNAWAGDPVKIGTAFYDRGRCLPWAMGTGCLVCEEWWPTSPKAICLVPTRYRHRQG